MKRHRATTSCPGIGPPRDDGPCDGVKRIGWQPDFYRIAILLWVERYHPELLLPGLRDEIIPSPAAAAASRVEPAAGGQPGARFPADVALPNYKCRKFHITLSWGIISDSAQ